MSDINILGDNRKSRFDPKLAERLNDEAEKEFARDIKKMKKSLKHVNLDDISESPGEYIVGNNFAITMMPGDLLDSTKNHDSWTEYWFDHGLVMASMPEFYQMFKQIAVDIKFDVVHKLVKAHAMITNLRYQMRQGHLIITDTKITYGGDMRDVHVDHRLGYDNRSLWTGCDAAVKYRKAPSNSLMHMSSDSTDADFIRRALFETEDDMDTISSSLKFASENSTDFIRISTPDYSMRKNSAISQYAVLAMDEECFRIKLDLDAPVGLSYGIRYLDGGTR